MEFWTFSIGLWVQDNFLKTICVYKICDIMEVSKPYEPDFG